MPAVSSAVQPISAADYDRTRANVDLLLEHRDELNPDEMARLRACMRVLSRGYRSNPILDELCPHVHPKQAAFLALNDREVMYGGSAGGGKALATDTPVPTPSGWSTMLELQPGDQVFDESGQPCTVLACSEVMFRRQCFRLEFSDGSQIVADADHLWVTMTDSDRAKAMRCDPAWRAARRAKRKPRGTGKRPDVALKNTRNARRQESSLAVAPLPAIRTTLEIAETLESRPGRKNHSVNVAGPLELPRADLPIQPYILGAWLGDGNSESGRFTTADQEIVESFRDAGYQPVKSPNRKYSYGTRGLTRLLRLAGILNNKHIPAAYLRASRQQRLELLQGLMDTDGHCDQRGQCEFTTTKQVLSECVLELVLSLGIKAVATESRAKLNGRDIGPKFRIKFLSADPVFRLARKLERQKLDGFRPTVTSRYIVAAEEVSSVPVRCITVSADSGCFLAGRTFIPTHNSQAAIMAALQYVDVPGFSAILFRKTFTDLSGEGALMDRAQKMFMPLERRKICRWSASDKSFFFPTRNADGTPGADSRIAFGYLDHPTHKFRYQGWEFQLCVAGGTLIAMADGRWLPARAVQPGDMVRTLEGPRVVLRKAGPMHKPCVSATTRTPAGTFSQIQSADHRLLTPGGWIAFSDTSGSRAAGSTGGQTGTRFHVAVPGQRIPVAGLRRTDGSAGQPPDRHYGQGICVCAAGPETGSSVSGGSLPAGRPLPPWFAPATPVALDLPSAGPTCVPACLPRAHGRDCCWCATPGFQAGCRFGHGSGDAQLRLWTGISPASSPLPGDAGEPCRSHLRWGGPGNAPLHSLQHPSTPGPLSRMGTVGENLLFVHQECAGSGETDESATHSGDDTLRECILWTPGLPAHRRLSAPLPHPYVQRSLRLCEPVSCSPLSMSPVGIREVYDFTIDSASHYLTAGGFINANCDFDELTQHPEDSYRYLFSRLRRLEGHAVPIRMRSQTNPGGPHGEWVKDRFIPDEYLRADPDTQFSRIWRKSGVCVLCEGSGTLDGEECPACEGAGEVSRVFVPARVEDNPSLDRREYLASLAALPPTERAQLQHGRWDVVPDGDLFLREWFRYYSRRGDHFVLHTGPDERDEIVASDQFVVFHTADTASKTKTFNDWTVIATWALDTRNYNLMLLQVIRRRMKVPELVPAILNVYRQFNSQFVMVEDASSGIGLIQELRTSRGKGINVRDFNPHTGDVVSRATPAIIRAEAGQIYLPSNEPPWLADYLNEIVSFSGSPDLHDDCVDTLSMAAWHVSTLHNRVRSGSGDRPVPVHPGPLGSPPTGGPAIRRW